MGETKTKTEAVLDIPRILMKYSSTLVYLYKLAYFWGGSEGLGKL